MPGRLPSWMRDKMPGRKSDKYIADSLPDKMRGKMAYGTPDRMPKFESDRILTCMPEYLPGCMFFFSESMLDSMSDVDGSFASIFLARL